MDEQTQVEVQDEEQAQVGVEAEAGNESEEQAEESREVSAEDLAQQVDDLTLILNAYVPDGFDLKTELGRITRAGTYEPMKVRQPRVKSPAKRATRVSSAAQQETDYLQMFKDNATKAGMIGATPGTWGQDASH